jgi:hypothetical protein
MIAKILLERLDEPNRNGHVYTTKCINDAIINNEAVQERLHNKEEFVIDGNKSDDAENVIDYLKSGSYPTQDLIGIVLNYYIKNNCLYATIDFKDDVFTDNIYMAGIGCINKDGIIDDY